MSGDREGGSLCEPNLTALTFQRVQGWCVDRLGRDLSPGASGASKMGLCPSRPSSPLGSQEGGRRTQGQGVGKVIQEMEEVGARRRVDAAL